MTTRFLSILFIVILLISALSLSASAAESDAAGTGATTIASVMASVTEPAVGQAPSYSASIPSGKGYKVSDRTSGSYQHGISWSVASEGDRNMSSGEKFEKGKRYMVSILLSTSSAEYEFGSSVSAKINNQDAKLYRNSSSSLRINYTFTNLDTDIPVSSASCTITAPAAGNTKDGSPISGDSEKYSVSLNVCYQENPYKYMGTNDKFEAGKTYVYAINFTAKAGYTFNSSTEYYINGVKAEKYSGGVYSAKFTVSGGASGYSVSGKVTSFLDDSGAVTLMLFKKTSITDTFVAFTNVYGNDAAYSFGSLAAGTYKLSLGKKNHVTRDYEIAVSGNTTLDVEIHLLGDIDGDGAVNNFDYGRINSHARNKSKLTDYAFFCADIDGDGYVNNFDAGRVNSHARGKSSLWK